MAVMAQIRLQVVPVTLRGVPIKVPRFSRVRNLLQKVLERVCVRRSEALIEENEVNQRSSPRRANLTAFYLMLSIEAGQ